MEGEGAPAAGGPHGAGRAWGGAGGAGTTEAGSGRARGAEQRSGERVGAGTGIVAMWRRREGVSDRPADGARPAAARDRWAVRHGLAARPAKQGRGKGADRWATATVSGGILTITSHLLNYP
jgi:hypothetical protein